MSFLLLLCRTTNYLVVGLYLSTQCDNNYKFTFHTAWYINIPCFALLQFYVGTSISNIYRFNHVSDLKPHLISTSHHQGIQDIAFAL